MSVKVYKLLCTNSHEAKGLTVSVRPIIDLWRLKAFPYILKKKSNIYSLFIFLDNSKIFPKSQSLHIGEQAEFTCNSFRDVQWHKLDYTRTNLLPLPKFSGVNGNMLVFKYLKMEHSGCYECTGQTEDVNIWSKHYVQFSARACLVVLSKSSEAFN